MKPRTGNDLARYLPPESELEERFLTAGGPGGQHVNRAATAIQLRFDAQASPSLAPEVRERLIRLAGRRADRNGVITITVRTHRSQHRNRQEARRRLAALIARASRRPRSRKPTAPPAAERRKRLDEKRKHARLKALRKPPPEER